MHSSIHFYLVVQIRNDLPKFLLEGEPDFYMVVPSCSGKIFDPTKGRFSHSPNESAKKPQQERLFIPAQ